MKLLNRSSHTMCMVCNRIWCSKWDVKSYEWPMNICLKCDECLKKEKELELKKSKHKKTD